MSQKLPNLDEETLRRLPKVDKVLQLPEVKRLESEVPRWAVVDAVRSEIARLREALRRPAEPGVTPAAPAVDTVRIAASARDRAQSSLRPVINATGVVLHTNLGRAPLSTLAVERLAALGGRYQTLEYRLSDGERGSRQDHLQELIQTLTGAPACLVVNNNAAAVLLMLGGLCSGKEVIVSRGELVEIGGSFRIPDVMRASGARLREVGTTNRTHLADYKEAIGPETRALLKVHRSNFAIVGFTAEVSATALSRCAHEAGLLSLFDLGSGDLVGQGHDYGQHGGSFEPKISEAVAAGCDVLSFSCDKLLGGPQAGVLCGTKEALKPLRQHPLLRALRPDKLTLLALQATLELYRDGRQDEIPVVAMLGTPLSTLRERALRLAGLCQAQGLAVDVLPTRSAIGGGALPLVEPDSFAVSPLLASGKAVRSVEAALRTGVQPPVIARISDDRLLCDVRTVFDDELSALAAALVKACAGHDNL